MKTTSWVKSGEWKMAANEGPWYRHTSGRVIVRGSWGTLGSNGAGWRKQKCYTLVVDGVEVDWGTLARLQAKGEKLVAGK